MKPFFPSWFSKKASLALGNTCVWLALCGASYAQVQQSERPDSLFYGFLPPQVSESTVCYADLNEPIGEDWLPHWVGAEFVPSRMGEVRPDFKKLQFKNAERWQEEIERAIGWLVSNNRYYTELHAANDLISLYLKIDRPEEIIKRNLVINMIRADINMTSGQMVQIADLIMLGEVVPGNRNAGLALLVKAAFLGKAQAILRLVALSEQGEDIPFWDVDSSIAIDIAMNDIIGDLNAQSCEQANRVAGMFAKGSIVPRDMEMAQKWYTFSAKLGDGTAAWRIARMHIDAMEIDRDVDLLMKYLKQAAAAGLIQARLVLAETYEQGTLVERDLDAALAILREDSEAGYDVSRVALASFLLKHRDRYPDLQPLRIATLKILSQIEDSRGWVYTHLGRYVLEEQGRWNGEAAARALFEVAVERRDNNALIDLAELALSNHSDPTEFNYAIDLMELYLLTEGNLTTVKKIVSAYVCRSPQAPNTVEAAYWEGMVRDMGLTTVPFTPQEIRDINWEDNPVELARVQTRALNNTPRPLLDFYTILEVNIENVSGDSAYFKAQLALTPSGLRYWGEQTFDNALNVMDQRRGLALLNQSADMGNLRAATNYAARLQIMDDSDEALADVQAILVQAAKEGSGRAIFELSRLSAHNGQSISADLWEEYREMINRNGDFYGLVFAMTQTTGAQRQIYLDRAVAVMRCDFDEAITMVDLYTIWKNQPEIEIWLDIAEQLINQRPARMIKFGDRVVDLLDQADQDRAKTYYQQALQLGSNDALPRLSRIFGDEESEFYSPEIAAELLTEMLLFGDASEQGKAVELLQNMHNSIQEIIDTQVDIDVIYGVQAQLGNPVAMREYAFVLRSNSVSDDSLAEAAIWLERAAITGDARSMYELSLIFAFGLGVLADAERANLWLQNAADAGNGKARALFYPAQGNVRIEEIISQ